jgi:hypothetical protein
MATDNWLDDSNNWDTPSDWSAGLPDASSDVEIFSGADPQVTASFGTVNSIKISGRRSTLTFIDAGASSVTAHVTLGNSQGTTNDYLLLDASTGEGGSTVTIGGRLNNYGGFVEIGPADNKLSAPSTIEAGEVLNGLGVINLDGSGAMLKCGGRFDNDGLVNLNLSTLEAGEFVNGLNGVMNLDGSGAIHATLKCGGAFTNDGSVDLRLDTETIGGAVSGTGDFSLRSSTLEFVHGVSSGETVTFDKGVNHLYLDSPSSFSGTIGAFSAPGDSVIAKGFAEAATMLTYKQGADSCSWTLNDGAHTAVLNFAGAPYKQSDFAISSSANGATLIKFI